MKSNAALSLGSLGLLLGSAFVALIGHAGEHSTPATAPQQHAQPAPQQHAQPAPQQHAQPAPEQHTRAIPEQHANPAPRAAPPPFEAHPSGAHPQGVTVPRHQTRVLAPAVVAHERTGWSHWEHPEFARPHYYWNWTGVLNVTCIAEDSYGDQYPVSEAATPGFGLSSMTGVEDDALDRCYSESGQDTTCVLATCSPN